MSAERPIPLQFTKSAWFPTIVILSLLALALLLAVPSARPATTGFVTKNWGSIASVVGLIITGITLWVARKAKEAAEAANQESRRRNLAEDLQGAHAKAQEVGQFIRDGQWHAVFLRSQEITGACSLVLNRWSAELTKESRENITRARTQADSIAAVAMKADRVKPTEREILTVSASQRRLHGLLSGELGESLRVIERSPEPNV